MPKPRPYVVPATVVKVDAEPNHVRLTVYPTQGPTAMHPVVVTVNKTEFPEWASVKAGTRVRVGIVMETESGVSPKSGGDAAPAGQTQPDSEAESCGAER